MTNWLKEIEEVINWVRKNYPTIQKIILAGHSMGGMLSLLYPVTHPEISAVISIMGGPPFIRKETYEERMVEWKAEGVKVSHRDDPVGADEKITIQLPFSFVEDSLQYDVSKMVPKIRCPVLLIGGENDVLVPAKQMSELGKQFPKDQIAVQIFPKMGHNYRRTDTAIKRVNNSVIEFLNKKNLL